MEHDEKETNAKNATAINADTPESDDSLRQWARDVALGNIPLPPELDDEPDKKNARKIGLIVVPGNKKAELLKIYGPLVVENDEVISVARLLAGTPPRHNRQEIIECQTLTIERIEIAVERVGVYGMGEFGPYRLATSQQNQYAYDQALEAIRNFKKAWYDRNLGHLSHQEIQEIDYEYVITPLEDFGWAVKDLPDFDSEVDADLRGSKPVKDLPDLASKRLLKNGGEAADARKNCPEKPEITVVIQNLQTTIYSADTMQVAFQQPDKQQLDSEEVDSEVSVSDPRLQKMTMKRKRRAQVLLKCIRELGYNPENIPAWKYNEGGVKARARESLASHPNFKHAKSSFKTIWEECCNIGLIQYAKAEGIPKNFGE